MPHPKAVASGRPTAPPLRRTLRPLRRCSHVALAAGAALLAASATAGAQMRGDTAAERASTARGAAIAGMPQLRRQGSATQLVVDGAPLLIRGGELGNSTASDVAGMHGAWPRLRAMGLNTVLAPVYWELVEPSRGRYDFARVDSLLADARAHELHLVLLWFGTWKNSMSTYVPEYVKLDQARHPRTEATRGQGQEILAPYADATADVDARAFAALMRHLRAVDGTRHTVLMVQVENEIGMIPEARDHSAAADALFAGPVPDTLLRYLAAHRTVLAPELRARWEGRGARRRGSWAEVFGPGLATDELFMAWHFARYADRVAAAGKAEYPLPMFANAALIRPGYQPGRYVSAGPLPHLVDVWRAAAPAVDFIAPDVYFPNFAEWVGRYASTGGPLFVPEARHSPQSPVDALYAVGAHGAIGYSPFAIESADSANAAQLGRGYDLLAQLAPVIVAHQGRGTIAGVMPPTAFDGSVDDTPQRVELAGAQYALTVAFAGVPGPPTISPGMPGAAAIGGAAPPPPPRAVPPRGGLIVALGADEFLVAGTGMVVTFAPRGPGAPTAGILSLEEGRYVDGRWVAARRLNGDQTHQGRHLSIPLGEFGIQRVRLYRYR